MTEVRSYYVTEGNTVRVEAVPLPNRREERKEEENRRKRARRREQAAVMRRKKAQAIMVVMTVMACCALFVGYVNLTNSITTHMKNIADLQEEITMVKADNSAISSRIATAANLSYVKNTAETELGMVYAKADQIVYYEVDDADFMNQYHKIP